MKKCNYCNGILEDSDCFCRYCGKKVVAAKTSVEPKEDENTQVSSLILKYSNYLDNESLFSMAEAKERGLIRSEFPDEAYAIYKLLAFKGHLESTFRYAIYLLNKPEPQEKLAYKWLKIAAEKGHTPSVNMLKTNDWGSVREGFHAFENDVQSIKETTDKDAFVSGGNGVIPSIVMITTTNNANKNDVSKGSGFVIKKGLVVTNAHVIGDDPECIEASFEPSVDKNSYVLYPILVKEEYDIAVLSFADSTRKNGGSFKGVEISSDGVKFGEEVYTVGNPLGIGLSVSKGIVSNPARVAGYPSKVKSVIQTDITINHGNSGGALFNKSNKVVGIATFVPSASEGGIGMCVPSEYIEKIIKEI